MMKKTILIFCAFCFFTNCKKHPDLATVKNVDIEKYQGLWYEIAKLPNRFEKGLTCITANYTLLDDGKIEVWNNGIKNNNPNEISSIKGKAKPAKEGDNSKLKVSFFGPFYGDYYIIDLDENYQYAMIGEPSREFFWILSRTPKIGNSLYNQLLEKAEKLGFDTSKVEKCIQNCEIRE
jgi:apolipoprotein D and lipocalin family protein